MHRTIRALFSSRIWSFIPPTLCALFLLTFISSWPAQAQSNPPSSFVPDDIDQLPAQLLGYDLFTADSQAGWAYLTFVQWQDGQIAAFQIALGEFDEAGKVWRIYGEGTAEYIQALPRLPSWLQWLARMEEQRQRPPSASPQGTYSLPGLPWKPDLAWRYNQGPQTANHLDAFDFGVPTSGVQDDVYFAEDGIVIGTNVTCIIVERPSDGLRHFYQHIQSSDIYQFSFGEQVTYKQKVGRTTLASGCGGTTTGHHLHFAFYTPYGGPIMNPQGFVMNGWQVVGNTLVKGDEVASPNYVDTLLHDATQFVDEFESQTLSPEWFWVREDDANWSLSERPDFLRIYTQNGSLGSADLLPENLLLRAAMRAGYELIVRFEGVFTENYHEAVLLLYQDDDNFLALSRLFDDVNYGGDIYRFGRQENGETAEGFTYTEAAETVTELRLLVTDSFVMGFFRNEAGEWVSIGRLDVDGIGLFPYIGLSAYQGQPEAPVPAAAVDFDSVLARPFEPHTVYLPSMQQAP